MNSPIAGYVVTLLLRCNTFIANTAARVASGIVLVLGFTSAVHAIPVTYTSVVFGVNASAYGPAIPGPTGQIGGIYFGGTYGEVIITLTFEGDTVDVVPWSVVGPSNLTVSGYEILKGTASVEIQDSSTHAILVQGTFDPTAGIFVSIDNVNLGIGIGSQAVWPATDPNFPGQPAYPFAHFLYPSNFGGINDRTYDLKSDFDSGLVGGWSCVGFPNFPCLSAFKLPTSAGDLYINPVGLDVPSYFHTTLHPIISFSSFQAEVGYARRNHALHAAGHFKLGTSSNGINPLSEPVAVHINGFTETIPADSFVLNEDGLYSFEGPMNGVRLKMSIWQVKTGVYSFSLDAHDSKLVAPTVPTTIALTIGDDSGTTTSSGSVHDD